MIIEDIQPNRGFCWNRVNPEYVSPEMFNKIINDLKADKTIVERNWERMSIKYIRISNTWTVNSSDGRKEIRVNKLINTHSYGKYIFADADFHRYIWLENKVIPVNSEIVENEKTGMYYYQTLEDKFNECNGTKTCALESIFSGRKYKWEYTSIKELVPVQISFINPFFVRKKLGSKYNTKPIFKADVSSAFPTQIMKDLPTLHNCIRVGGRVEPSEDFPFAFYLKSKHIKTYDGYDSHELDSVFYTKYYKCDDSVSAEDDETILCPKMSKKYHEALMKAFQYCYDHRKEDADNKMIMNATIGYFHRNNNPALSMIAAIVILRCNVDMIRRCKQLTSEGNKVLFIATDSIAWMGKLSSVATDEKHLGTFTYEGKDIEFLGLSPKAYQWVNSEGKCTTKYSGMKKEESAKLKFGELIDIYKGDDDKEYYQYDEEAMQFFKSALI